MEATVIGTRISASGQTTVPAAVRAALDIPLGSTVYWAVNDQGVASVAAHPSLAPTTVLKEAPDQVKVPTRKPAYESIGSRSEWPDSFWETLGALDDPSFVVPPDLDEVDDALRIAFDGTR